VTTGSLRTTYGLNTHCIVLFSRYQKGNFHHLTYTYFLFEPTLCGDRFDLAANDAQQVGVLSGDVTSHTINDTDKLHAVIDIGHVVPLVRLEGQRRMQSSCDISYTNNCYD